MDIKSRHRKNTKARVANTIRIIEWIDVYKRQVFDREDVETVLQHVDMNPTTPRTPTGFFLQSMEFLNANDILITGYIWQNISSLGTWKELPDFSFPDSKETAIEKVYVNKDTGVIAVSYTHLFCSYLQKI